MNFPFSLSPLRGRTGTIATTILVVAALYFGKPFLAPLALAILFAFLLSPLAGLLQRRLRLPVAVASTISVLLATAVVAGIGFMLATQVLGLMQRLPEYRGTLKAKLRAVQGIGADIAEVQRQVEDLQENLEEAANGKSAGTGLTPPKPPKVEVAAPEPPLFDRLRGLVGPMLRPLTTAAMVFLLTLFLLAGRVSLTDRVVGVLSTGNVAGTRHGLHEATSLISRYLLTTLAVNASYGIPVGIGLALLGMPNAFLWGLLATLLRFIPYIGPWVAASLPITLSLAVFDSWTGVLSVVGLFVGLELISNNFVEPWIYGRRTGLSPQAIVVAAFFWTWIWGGVGLFLAVPLTLCLAVAGRYVPELSFLHVLLSSDEDGIRRSRLLAHLLSGNRSDAHAIAAEHVREKGYVALFDELGAPAQWMAESALARGSVERERVATLREDLAHILFELPVDAGRPEGDDGRPVVLWRLDARSRCAQQALARILEGTGHRVIDLEAGAEAKAAALDLNPDIGALGEADLVLVTPHLRFDDHLAELAASLRADGRFERVIVYLWSGSAPDPAMHEALTASGAALALHLDAALSALARAPDAGSGTRSRPLGRRTAFAARLHRELRLRRESGRTRRQAKRTL